MSAPSVVIGDRVIGEARPCFVIGEAGVNHNGDPEQAHQLIDAIASAGADAVKFQTFVPEELAAADAPKAAYQERGDSSADQLDMLRRLALPQNVYVELRQHADEAGILFMSSPFDEGSVALLEKIGIPAWKVPSGEVTNHGLLRKIASTGKPIIMSTGMCTTEEIRAAVEVIGAVPLALLHCVSNYPTAPRDCNLRAMATLRTEFGVPVGWSDHSEGIAVSIAAAALGACIIEKHVTLSRDLPGPDHRASIEPGELGDLVRGVREAQAALGTGDKQPSESEMATAAVARKSLHWQHDHAAGHVVERGDFVALRPGTGISPARQDSLFGRQLRHDVQSGAMVREEDVE